MKAILRAAAKRPDNRWQSAGAFADALETSLRAPAGHLWRAYAWTRNRAAHAIVKTWGAVTASALFAAAALVWFALPADTSQSRGARRFPNRSTDGRQPASGDPAGACVCPSAIEPPCAGSAFKAPAAGRQRGKSTDRRATSRCRAGVTQSRKRGSAAGACSHHPCRESTAGGDEAIDNGPRDAGRSCRRCRRCPGVCSKREAHLSRCGACRAARRGCSPRLRRWELTAGSAMCRIRALRSPAFRRSRTQGGARVSVQATSAQRRAGAGVAFESRLNSGCVDRGRDEGEPDGISSLSS